MEVTIEIYQTKEGKTPFSSWLDSLEIQLRARVLERLARVQLGNFGDVKALKGGIYELRLAFGAGYRIYFGKQNNTIVLLLTAGSKASQEKDIEKARDLWALYCQERSH